LAFIPTVAVVSVTIHPAHTDLRWPRRIAAAPGARSPRTDGHGHLGRAWVANTPPWRGRSAERRIHDQSRVAEPLRRVRLSTLHRGDFCPRGHTSGIGAAHRAS
jgi:hypothetical protein